MFFFSQAEDGIRDVAVTGVQTCALPIYILSLEQEARKILSPVQETPKPIEPVAEHSIAPPTAPALEPVVHTVPAVEPAPVATAAAPTEAAPTPTPAPAPHDPTLPPRAP